MNRREITERERERERALRRERNRKKETSARQKREPRCFRAFFFLVERERERKEIYRTITPQVDFFSRVKNKNNSIAGVHSTHQVIDVRHASRVNLLVQHRVPLAEPSVEFRYSHGG
jgi:hypothetical protein